RGDGPVVEALLAAGLTVVVISPNQVKNLRSRYGSAGNDASLSVVKLAVGVLRAEGLVIGQQGKGVFVREDAVPAPPASDELTEIRATLQSLSARLERVESRLAERE
ncbi:hypothetical protein ABT356_03910, partial [Streptosporangium roseum]